MTGALQTHAKTRGLAVGVVAIAAIALRLSAPTPPPRTVDGVTEALGKAVHGKVGPDDFLWEPKNSFFEDAFVGRHVLFLAAPGEGAPRDLYRARVRLTRSGRPISIGSVRNLTRTPLGDDRDLAGAGHHVAFVTSTLDGVQGITLLDLHGAPPPPEGSRWKRALSAADHFLATGSSRGLARTEIAFSSAPSEARFEVAQNALVLSLGAKDEALPAALDFTTNSLQTGPNNPFGAVARRIPEHARAPDVVLTELAGNVLGPKVERLLERALDRAKSPVRPRFAAVAPDGLRLGADYRIEAGWPPKPLAPPHPEPFDGEGQWHLSKAIFGPRHEVVPPALLETVVRPDTAQPDALAHLIAIDTRRLEVQTTPGVAFPQPQTGPHGTGTLPEGAGAKDVMATFVAGPVQGNDAPYGFFGQGRLFSPIVPGAQTLAVRPDGRAILGAFPEDGARDAFVAIAQGPDALSESAPPDPERRMGRAALCRTSLGYLLYAFSPSASATTLRAGLSLAGCESAMHLGAAPSPLGFAYLHAEVSETGSASYTGTLAAPFMTMEADRIGGPWREQMGIIKRRRTTPAVFSSKAPTWEKDEGTQPIPEWLPAIFTAETEKLGAKVKLYALMPDRVVFKIATGTDETVITKGNRPGPPAEAPRLAVFGLSVARRGVRRGLMFEGAMVARPGSEAAWVALDGSRVTIGRPGEPPPKTGDATQLPLVADEGALLRAAREVGSHRPRSALCVGFDGTVFIAHTTFDTDEATTEALLDTGCERVVAFDRGAHDGVMVHRAGTQAPPQGGYEATTIQVLPGNGAGTALGAY